MQIEVKPIMSPKSTKSIGDIIQWMNEFRIEDGIASNAWHPQHLYIIDEKAPIKEGDWFYDNHMLNIDIALNIGRGCDRETWIDNKNKMQLTNIISAKKILCTTDATLIADGVPSISEEFLKEFVARNGKSKTMMEMDRLYFETKETGLEQFAPKLDQSGNAILTIVPLKLQDIASGKKSDWLDAAKRRKEKRDCLQEITDNYDADKKEQNSTEIDPIEEAAKNRYPPEGALPFHGDMGYMQQDAFKTGWKANPAKFTEDDMIAFANKVSFRPRNILLQHLEEYKQQHNII